MFILALIEENQLEEAVVVDDSELPSPTRVAFWREVGVADLRRTPERAYDLVASFHSTEGASDAFPLIRFEILDDDFTVRRNDIRTVDDIIVR